jgi:phosphate transport system substrate-binding protein
MAEEFPKTEAGKGVRVVVGRSGTGGGFEKFVSGETDISDASRPIKPTEIEKCKQKGIEYVELKVAIDGLTVVVHPDNDWCDALTVAELKTMWTRGSSIKKWSDVRKGFPNAPIKFFGAGSDSGTYDYFIEAILGKKGQIRTDYTPSEDDNVLVAGVSQEKNAIGFFGFAYYVKNKGKLKAVKIAPKDDLKAAVEPTNETVLSGKYTPLSRPLFIYPRKDSLQRKEVAAFVTYYLNDGQKLIESVGYVKLPDAELAESRKRLEAAIK